ncbi:MAG: ADP-ribosyltransferase [Peptostreptococcaceae bacterium]|nr:ADP-ribosyltransferase [Peptostreptococcaceae bacterium]
MAKDIVPDLLAGIIEDFERGLSGDKNIRKAIELLELKKANYKNANEFSVEVGNVLANVLQGRIKAEDLPDGRMYYNIAERILNPTMGKAYDMIADYSKDVQTELNHAAKLKIKGLKADLDQDRIDGIVNKISTSETFEEVAWLLDEPIRNFCQSIVDDTIQTNVDHHHKLGLQPIIKRISTGDCCDWCDAIDGIYQYPDVPQDIYRRHRYCRCRVDYYPGDGRVQNVHTKRWTDPRRSDKIEERKKINLQPEYKIANKGTEIRFQNQSNDAYKKMTQAEREALKEYTEGGYDKINSDLAIGNRSAYEDSLNSAIDHFVLDEDIVTYRGTNEKYFKSYQVGDVFESKVFYSTSLDHEQAKAFAEDATAYDEDGYKGVLLEIRVPKKTKVLYIGENTDYKPSGYTVNEKELLISNKTKYQVKDIKKGEVILEVVGDGH